MKTDIDLLLARYFGGSATEMDMEYLEQWLSSSDDNQLQFDEMTSLYSKLNSPSTPVFPKNEKNARKLFLEHMIPKNTIKKESNAFKITSNTKQWMFRAAGVVILFLITTVGLKMYFSEKQVIVASNFKTLTTTLTDNTTIALEPDSKISYSSHYGKKARIIHLDGKATFKAGHTGNGALQICTNEIIIEDIGTVFEVSAYKDSNFVSVKVKEGKVHFYSKQDKGLLLSANEKGVYNKSTKVFELQEPELTKLNTGAIRVNFKGLELKQVFQVIGDAYGVTIASNNKLIGTRKITVAFEGENLDMVLDVIAETLNLDVERNANGYLFRNKIAN